MDKKFMDATAEEIDAALVRSAAAFNQYKNLDLKSRARFLSDVAEELELRSDQLIETAGKETHLDTPRLQVELKRTIFQLTSYAEAC
ncbi:MAG: aldehyde dehydrogenase family protein, partial [Chitinophagaceae bacterium]